MQWKLRKLLNREIYDSGEDIDSFVIDFKKFFILYFLSFYIPPAPPLLLQVVKSRFLTKLKFSKRFSKEIWKRRGGGEKNDALGADGWEVDVLVDKFASYFLIIFFKQSSSRISG